MSDDIMPQDLMYDVLNTSLEGLLPPPLDNLFIWMVLLGIISTLVVTWLLVELYIGLFLDDTDSMFKGCNFKNQECNLKNKRWSKQ